MKKKKQTRLSWMLGLVGLMILLFLAMLFSSLITLSSANRQLAEEYIEETGNLYVSQINKNISQINLELIQRVLADERLTELPNEAGPEEERHYALLAQIREQNKVMKSRHSEATEIFVYGEEAGLLITCGGAIFATSEAVGTSRIIRDFLREPARSGSQGVSWAIIGDESAHYMIGWYSRFGRTAGCLIDLDAVLGYLGSLPHEYEIIPMIEAADGRRIWFDDAEETASAKLYTYRFGMVGSLNMYVTQQKGSLYRLTILQNALIAGISLLILIFAGIFIIYYRKLKSLRIELYEQELEKSKTELERVQEQVRPHFFLNCLSLIHGIADSRAEKDIKHITELLSDYIRYLFKNDSDVSRLRDEIKQVDSFVQIQRLRYGDEAFLFESSVEPELENYMVPQLILSTLVENSFIHAVGMDEKVDIDLFITREWVRGEAYLYICVSDTGPGFDEEIIDAIMENRPILYNGRKHIGLQNIAQRLRLLYKEKARFQISNMDDGFGAVTEIWIALDSLKSE